MEKELKGDVLDRTMVDVALDDEDGNCKRCGHPFNPHIIIAYDVSDFSKGGKMQCPVESCSCLSDISFDFKQG